MFSRFDKAWAALLATFVTGTMRTLFAVELDTNTELAIQTAIVTFFVWLIPNKEIV